MTPFWFFALATALIAFALGVVVNRHPVRSAMCLAATLFLHAVMYVFLDAHLVAALQIIVYAGAILVLFLFVIMLLNLQEDLPVKRRRGLTWAAVGGGTVFGLGVLWGLSGDEGALPGPGLTAPVAADFGTSAEFAKRLFTQFVLPFEVTSILLLVAVLGAVVLAKKTIR